MPANVTCPNASCGKAYQVADEYLGRRGRCKSCGTEFVFSDASSASGQSGASGQASGSAETNKPISGTGTGASVPRTGRSSAPTRLGRFQILERVGMGGFGAVYRAQDPQLQRTVALKLLQSTGDDHRDQHRINRFLIEGRAGARLQHPNIVPVFDAGKDEETGEYYMAAAFIAGVPLAAAIDGQPLNLRRAATIVAQLARALEYAHSQGILHRDVKPDNVMLDEKDIPHLMDFGLARMEESESHLTRDGAVMGTPSYMSPEQCVGKQDALGPAADQYSLGCLLYELITGDKLFSGPVSVQIHHQINTEAPAPSAKNRLIPPDLDTICLKTLTKEPDRRYASCAAFAADLEHWLADEPIQARKLTTIERWNRWRKRNPAIASLSLGLAITLLIGLFGITTQWIRAERHAHAAELAANEQRKATEVANQEKEKAEAAQKTAEAERRATQKSLAESYVQRGRFLCLQDEVAHGLLWMARGLQLMPAGEAAAARLIARRIGSWEPTLPKRLLLVPHEKPVLAARFEPQGKWFVTASLDQTARIWETTTGRPLCPPLQHSTAVNAVDVSPDGRRILTGSGDGTVRLWQAPEGMTIGEPMQHPAHVMAAAFADGGVIVSRTSANSLHFWDEATGKPRRDPVTLKSPAGMFKATRDRRTMIVEDAGELATFDIDGNETGPRIANLGFNPLRALAVAPDGQTVLAGGATGVSRRGLLRSWELSASRQPKHTVLEAPWTLINDAVFSPDGKWLLTGALNSTAERRSAQDYKRVGYAWHCPAPVRCVAYHPSENLVLTGGDDSVAALWSLPNPETERLVIRHPQGAYSVWFSTDDKRLLSAGQDNTARLWDATTGAAIGQPLQHDGTAIYSVFSPDGRVAASSGGHIVRLFNSLNATPIGEPITHPNRVMGIDFNRDGSLLLTACEDGIARLWDVSTRQLVNQTEPHTAKIWATAFSTDGVLFATGCGSDTGQHWGELRVWNAKTCKLVAGPMAHPGMITTAYFKRSNAWVVTASGDRAARVWDIKTSQVVRGPFWHPSTVNVAIFDPTEKMLVTSCGDGHVRFWDLESQQQFGPDLIHGEMAVGLSFSSDGRRLATGGLDGTVRVWDVPQPATGTPAEIERRIQRATGLKLTARGDLERMDAKSWNQTASATTQTSSTD